MQTTPAPAGRLAHFLDTSVRIAAGPRPWGKMLRTGAALAIGFGVFAAMGNLGSALVCAAFANLLIFMDQAGPLPERLAVIGFGALAAGLAAALGHLVSGSEAAIVAGTLAIAVAAGLIHSTLPGLEMAPRQALICFVACAYVPQIGPQALRAAAVGAALALAGAIVDSLLRRHVTGPALREARETATFPGLRFGLCYGLAAAAGLLLAGTLGADRPYWVTITTLVVMQPDRWASALRAAQRFAGTMAGVVLAFVIAVAAEPLGGTGVLIVPILLLPFLWPLGFARNHAVGVAILSTWILLLLDIAWGAPDLARVLFLPRLVDTALGCMLAVAGTAAAHLSFRRRTVQRGSTAP